MVKRTHIFLFLGLLLFIWSCKKRDEALRWNADWSLPIAYGSLGTGDLLPDSLLSVYPDSSVWLVFESELYKFDISELVGLKDTSLLDTFALPVFSPVSFSPGQTFVNLPEENRMDLSGAEVTEVVIRNGNVVFDLYSTVAGQIIYNYQIPSAKDVNGVSFSKFVSVPPGSATNKSHVSGTFSLAGYTIDLTGTNGNSYNKILTKINCKVDPDYGSNVIVSNQDTIFVENHLMSISIESAKGYFGSQELNTGWASVPFLGFKKFTSGAINVSQLSLDFKIENGIGVDGLIKINGIQAKKNGGSSVSLTHPIIGATKSMNRAYKVGNTIYPTNLNVALNEQNSNVISMLTLLPDSMRYNFDVSVNPLGNISAYNDFIQADSPLRVYLDAKMPLNLLASNLTLVDTIEINLADTSTLNSLTLRLQLKNGMPLSAKVGIAILDQNSHTASYVFSPSIIPSGNMGVNGKVVSATVSEHEIALSPKDVERLKLYGKVVLKIDFNTANNAYVQIYDYYKIDYNIKANANLGLYIR